MPALPRGNARIRGSFLASQEPGHAGTGGVESTFVHEQQLPRHRSRRGNAEGRDLLDAKGEDGMTTTTIDRRIRWSGILLVAGLILQMLTLPFPHPLAFMCFLM